ncbi:hypothetical protein GCM10008967_10520 [Bacillus carboniphilus]|uniref:PPM-type phosphatase domain-containing protein n=1 Tax=Bacillus carboniphilus TaxID=86663 RepID=A0ABN0W0I3_9BACI
MVYAKQSAEAVIDAAKEHIQSPVEDIMKACNEALQQKRGAAVTIVEFDYTRNEFTFCGVGNVKFHFVKHDGSTIYPLPVNGYLSGKGQSFKIRRYRYETPSRFILHTDGLSQMSHKKYLKMNMPLDYIYRTMVEGVTKKDDTTFVIGSLK